MSKTPALITLSAAEFNKLHPIGTPVWYWRYYEPVASRTTGSAITRYGVPSVSVDGVERLMPLDSLTLEEPSQDCTPLPKTRQEMQRDSEAAFARFGAALCGTILKPVE